METISVRFLESDVDMHIVTACEDTDTCPGCGAGYKAGFIECEYCRRPVKMSEPAIDEVAIREHFTRCYSGKSHRLMRIYAPGSVVPMFVPSMADER